MILLKRGAVAYSAYPYDERLCRRPGADTVARASAFRIADWRVVEAKRLDQVKAETRRRPSRGGRYAPEPGLPPS